MTPSIELTAAPGLCLCLYLYYPTPYGNRPAATWMSTVTLKLEVNAYNRYRLISIRIWCPDVGICMTEKTLKERVNFRRRRLTASVSMMTIWSVTGKFQIIRLQLVTSNSTIWPKARTRRCFTSAKKKKKSHISIVHRTKKNWIKDTSGRPLAANLVRSITSNELYNFSCFERDIFNCCPPRNFFEKKNKIKWRVNGTYINCRSSIGFFPNANKKRTQLKNLYLFVLLGYIR